VNGLLCDALRGSLERLLGGRDRARCGILANHLVYESGVPPQA
jgi:hypothetical protein